MKYKTTSANSFDHGFSGAPYGYVEIKDVTYRLPTFTNSITTGINPCPPAIIKSIAPINGSTLKLKTNTTTKEPPMPLSTEKSLSNLTSELKEKQGFLSAITGAATRVLSIGADFNIRNNC